MQMTSKILLLFAVACTAGAACDKDRVHHRPGDPRSTFELKFATEDPNGKAIEKSPGRRRFSLGNELPISSRDIRSVSMHPMGSYCALDIAFTRDAGTRIYSTTMKSKGQILAVLVDGQVASAPTITAPLGRYVQLVIAGGSCDETLQLARRIAP